MAFCEMCGASDNLKTSKVEGVTLKVCHNCTRYGLAQEQLSPRNVIRQPSSQLSLPEIKVVDDYYNILRGKREEMNLTVGDFAKIINERESLVSKWQLGLLKPNLNTAKKLEKRLNIKLLETESVESLDFNSPKAARDQFTLGDFITFRRNTKAKN